MCRVNWTFNWSHLFFFLFFFILFYFILFYFLASCYRSSPKLVGCWKSSLSPRTVRDTFESISCTKQQSGIVNTQMKERVRVIAITDNYDIIVAWYSSWIEYRMDYACQYWSAPLAEWIKRRGRGSCMRVHVHLNFSDMCAPHALHFNGQIHLNLLRPSQNNLLLLQLEIGGEKQEREDSGEIEGGGRGGR